jgi:hypothetical protein
MPGGQLGRDQFTFVSSFIIGITHRAGVKMSSVASTDVPDIASENDYIAVRIAYPTLSMVCSRVYMRPFNDCGTKYARLLYRGVKRAQLEPKQNTKTVRRSVCVAKVRMLMDVPRMKLENYFAILHNLFVFIPAMPALATKQLLVPTAAAFHVFYGNQGLSFHTVNLGLSGG